MKGFWLGFFVFLLSALSVPVWGQATSVQASVDKNPVMADESIILTVVANGDVDRNAFDPSSLMGDFVVGRTSISSQTRMVNFKTTRSTTWTTILIPKKQGRFTLGPFTIDGQKTQAIDMMVIPPVAATGGKPRDIFITAEVDRQEVYLQQQLVYTIKIFLFADLQRGSLPAPELEGAVIRPLGEDKEGSEIVDGYRYRTIERNFAIIPQRSGEFTISGPLFEGEIVDNQRKTFAYFNQSKPVNRIAPDVDIRVLPIVSGYTGHWLPSGMVQLNEEWQPDNEFKVGEPVTRTLTLTAVGLTEEQLPEIARSYPPQFKVYPDQASTATVVRDKNLIAQRVENIAIIPTVEGKFELPEIRVPWYNVISKKTEYATVPARTITVLPGTMPTQPSPTEAQVNEPPVAQTTLPLVPQQSGVDASNSSLRWWSISSWILLVLWLTTLFLWWRKKPAKVEIAQVTINNTETQAWSELQQALAGHEANRIYESLNRWATCVCKDNPAFFADSTAVLAQPEVKQEVARMFQHRYSAGQNQWTSERLSKGLTELREKLKKGASQQTLKPLYQL